MNQLPNEIEQRRLETLWRSASKHARNMNQLSVQISRDIAKEKTQYFEKIALASGATIALVVSFVGAHVGRLRPPWLLRSALVVLVLAMITAMYRNWKYPFYLIAAQVHQDLTAQQDRERCKRDYIQSFPAIAIEDGLPINVPEFLTEFAKSDDALSKKIVGVQKQERSAFGIVKIVERITLLLMLFAMSMLIALAWVNF